MKVTAQSRRPTPKWLHIHDSDMMLCFKANYAPSHATNQSSGLHDPTFSHNLPPNKLHRIYPDPLFAQVYSLDSKISPRNTSRAGTTTSTLRETVAPGITSARSQRRFHKYAVFHHQYTI